MRFYFFAYLALKIKQLILRFLRHFYCEIFNKQMKKLVFLILIFVGISHHSFGTHLRAGEITYTTIGAFSIRATITTYTEVGSNNYDDDSVRIYWGDGSLSEVVYRTNGSIGASGYPSGVLVRNGIKKNTYEGVHTYAGAPPAPNNFYLISTMIENRNDQILNIKNGNSVNTAFYVEDTVFFPGSISNWGYNSSPILLNPPVDFGNVGDTFYHNPLAYDPDGDSLIFEKIVPREAQNQFIFPYVYLDAFSGGTNTYTVNRFTGEIIWAVPTQKGNYNIAILIREYRRGVQIGTMVRDMQIIVDMVQNDPPQIDDLQDTCVRAGDLLRIDFAATDPQLSQTVTLTADGGPFRLASSLSPATFATTPGNPATARFSWQTICNHIQRNFYTVVVTASDNYSPPLTDLETWLIDVVAPPPTHLKATTLGNTAILSWDSYNCAAFGDFRGFSVWRKEGSNPFIPEYCETGLAGRGYTMIASNLFDTSYIDNTIKRGNEYCYRILAHFSKKSPNGIFEYDKVESVPSNETCIFLPYNIPLMTKVSVTTTNSTAGLMQVEWTKPIADTLLFDTTVILPPYFYKLYRNTGIGNKADLLIHTSANAANYSSFNDTTFTDNNLNTVQNSYTYKVAVFANGDSIGDSNTASSVFLSIQPRNERLLLNWTYNVPWRQDSFQLFRKDLLNPVYQYIATTFLPSYIDTGLVNDSTYCYYVKAFGSYAIGTIYKPLINLSQEVCSTPEDQIPPCPPILTVTNNCGDSALQYQNNLNWTLQTADSCDNTDIDGYKIYFAPTLADSLSLLQEISGSSQNSFTHLLQNSLAGCYAVSAFDQNKNESLKSNKVCIDNCPRYLLPNTFTPNGDGDNDYFTPFIPYYFVEKIELKIFNRWGEKVFETNDPTIMWDGKDMKTKKEVAEGVYFYAGYYWERTLQGEVKQKLPTKGSGEIHLIRGN